MLICIFSALAIQIQMLCSTMPRQINSNPRVLGERVLLVQSPKPLPDILHFSCSVWDALEGHPVMILWGVTAAWYFKVHRHWPGCYTFRVQSYWIAKVRGLWACSQSFKIQCVTFILSHPMIHPLNKLTELKSWHQMSCFGTSFALRPQSQEAPRCERKQSFHVSDRSHTLDQLSKLIPEVWGMVTVKGHLYGKLEM